jgi:hypothetical protein
MNEPAATKRDLDALESSLRSRLDLRLEAVEHRLRAEIATSARTTLIAYIGTTIGAIIAVTGLR